VTSDATPDTPVDPREVADKVAIEAARVYSRSIQRDLWAPMMFATSVAKQVVAALADAGLLVLPDEGSLRSQASGTPGETGQVTP
jgi:hypothetical protein